MNAITRAYALSAAGLLTALAPRAALAQTSLVKQGLDGAASGPYGQAARPDALPTLTGRLIGIAFDIFGILLLIYLLYGGYMWLTSGGPKKVETAQTTIKNAIIGVAILLSANFIAGYVLGQLDCVISGQLPTMTSMTMLHRSKAYAFASIIFLLVGRPAFAQQTSPSNRMLKQIGGVAKQSGQKEPTQQDLPLLIGSMIGTLISLLGLVLLIYLLYGGYLWMTAQGDEKQVEKARAVIKNAIIGMVIISMAYAISAFVISAIVNTSVEQGQSVPG